MIRFIGFTLFLSLAVRVVVASGNPNNNNPLPPSYSSVQEGALFGYSFSSDYLFGRVATQHDAASTTTEKNDVDAVKHVSESSVDPKRSSEKKVSSAEKGGSSHHDQSVPVNRRLYNKNTTPKRTTFLPYAP